jgi:exodeoxyribonuclease V alpha subunit
VLARPPKTLVRPILAVPRVKAMALALAAPTGRTAKRRSEVTGLEANTIACLL